MQTLRSDNSSAGSFDFGPWHVGYRLTDGGRLNSVKYLDYDLLTTAPSDFRPPEKEHGQFENRPVYGYDDCFPSVVACFFPGSRISIPDHGEVCWLPWEVSQEEDSLSFLVRSRILPFVFRRKMIFTGSSITWSFEVENEGDRALPFQHSMHPLIRPDELKDLQLPEFLTAFDWNRNCEIAGMDSEKLGRRLLSLPKGGVEMLFLRGIKTGEMGWSYSNGLSVRMKFPSDLFTTLGVWWDNDGYPDEHGIARNECAFEPTAGSTSLLSQASAEGSCPSVGAGEKVRWKITWEVKTTS